MTSQTPFLPALTESLPLIQTKAKAAPSGRSNHLDRSPTQPKRHRQARSSGWAIGLPSGSFCPKRIDRAEHGVPVGPRIIRCSSCPIIHSCLSVVSTARRESSMCQPLPETAGSQRSSTRGAVVWSGREARSATWSASTQSCSAVFQCLGLPINRIAALRSSTLKRGRRAGRG